MEQADASRRSWFGSRGTGALNVYVSFGTVVWRYYAAEALRALQVLTNTFASLDDVRVIVSLGGAAIPSDSRASLERANVSIETYVDQWAVLRDADAFVTHHGLNSTHEAIFHQVPMISYPFFWDQPALARRCQRLGLSIPLSGMPRAAFDEGDVRVAVARAVDERESMHAALARAQKWEKAVIDNRPAVLAQIAALAR